MIAVLAGFITVAGLVAIVVIGISAVMIGEMEAADESELP